MSQYCVYHENRGNDRVLFCFASLPCLDRLAISAVIHHALTRSFLREGNIKQSMFSIWRSQLIRASPRGSKEGRTRKDGEPFPISRRGKKEGRSIFAKSKRDKGPMPTWQVVSFVWTLVLDQWCSTEKSWFTDDLYILHVAVVRRAS
jgi:hypothetical protein